MGGIHGGWERNTERLVLMAYEQLGRDPGQIPSELTVFFVPGTNPDGLVAGSGPDSAWNARGVDLNRNFETANWSPDTFGRPGGRYGPTGTRTGGGGTAPSRSRRRGSSAISSSATESTRCSRATAASCR
jgi:hypothetical protein